jgi:hypothetical protein
MTYPGLPCYECAYRAEVPGSAHLRCVFDWIKHDPAGLVGVVEGANKHGIQRGWFRWPFNFDPVWGPPKCPQRADERDPAKVAPDNPLADLLSILG